MTKNKQTLVTKDAANRKIIVVREFDASPAQVWETWTTADLLDKWWAPKPWQARTKVMDFRVGGHWLYCMEGPDGMQAWCRVEFQAIDQQKSFAAKSCFCDEEGTINTDMPTMFWKNVFAGTNTGAKVTVEIAFDKGADYEKILQMGFEGGFTMALGNLDELLEKV